jgi:uncharacterized protein (UPF0147 family)
MRQQTVRLPSKPEEYESEERLIVEIKSFIHRYVDLSPPFEEIATYYVLFSWLYDGFNEVPYLRIRGDPGSGKTRFLITVGSLCYKPILASGASSISPIFRLLDSFRGTLVLDESDFRFSDEKSEMVKILNNGNVQGFPVLRSDSDKNGEFNPRAYHVFGPKIVATRGDFQDKALESRFITEEMGGVSMRRDVPISLPPEHGAEALLLRNKLLLFRFKNLGKRPANQNLVDPSLEPRINQIFVPLLSVIKDESARERLRAVARQCQREMVAERGASTEAQVLEVIQELSAISNQPSIAVKEITERFADLHSEEFDRKITPKWIGTIVRKKLRLKTQKSHGSFVIPESERPKLEQLFEKYGLSATPEPIDLAGSKSPSPPE